MPVFIRFITIVFRVPQKATKTRVALVAELNPTSPDTLWMSFQDFSSPWEVISTLWQYQFHIDSCRVGQHSTCTIIVTMIYVCVSKSWVSDYEFVWLSKAEDRNTTLLGHSSVFFVPSCFCFIQHIHTSMLEAIDSVTICILCGNMHIAKQYGIIVTFLST